MIRNSIISFFIFTSLYCSAQQYPWWTQYGSNQTLLNPGFCGTKRLIDFRINYRNQWTGYDGAPKTYILSLHSRLMKGKVGVGGFLFKDDIGPFRNFNTGFALAYHLKFPDSELSIGLQGNYISQSFIGTEITLHNQQDLAINQYITDKVNNFDGSFGIVYYNDRFHIGIAANNVASSPFEFYNLDTLKKGRFKNAPHYNLSAGYNFAESVDYVFENSILAVYVPGVPFSFDYTLRLHIKKQIMGGVSFRVNDAIALHLGCTIKEDFQFLYSYDIVTSPLRSYQKGTHEIKLVFSSFLGTNKKKHGLNGRFLKQRFKYLL